MKDDKAAIGKRLRKLRKGHGLTQIELSAKSGVTSNTIARVEQGKQQMSEPTVKKLSGALQVSASDILGY